MYIVIPQYLTWQEKQFQQTTGVFKMHKHLELADLHIHEHEISPHKAWRSMTTLRKARNSSRAIYEQTLH